ncbi:DUF1697 domain-containing protein [Virgibacillus siamensis]|uniref:DUF1697 domain-containing protein n=1 Tax=Virgibacillus siamensis TaxID=480071 RepID=UPI003183A50D
MLRTKEEWHNLIKECPYATKELSDDQSIHISFLETTPSEQSIRNLGNFENTIDSYQLSGREVYLFFGQNTHKSNLQRHLSKLGVSATLRNWRTVQKLEMMLKEREG